jgi:hypothetical protein
MSEWRDVGTVLLGSWPTQVAAWGREGIAAYLGELKGRGLTPEAAITALRCCSDRWPPNASEVAAQARRDPSQPTFDEALVLMRRSLKAEDPIVWLQNRKPLVASFLDRTGLDRFRVLPIDDPDWGERHRRDLRDAWDRHTQAMEGREIAALASGPRTGLRQLDPLASLSTPTPQIGEAS